MRLLTFGLLLAVGCSSACTRDMRYRYFPDQPCGSPGCINLPARENGPGWALSFIEFRDNGAAWDARQTTEALNLIRQSQADNDGATVVLLYVHGWKNNANDSSSPSKPKDVEKFRTALNRVALLAPPREGKVPRLIGIYIGWRGGTINVEPLKTLTYWPRRATARRVGRSALFDTMASLVDAAKPAGNDQARLILVGHSFGARVLENAVDDVSARDQRPGPMLQWKRSVETTRAATAVNATTEAPKPPADLVVFVNAATQSSISERTIRRLREQEVTLYGPGVTPELCAKDPLGTTTPACRPLPIYVALSSTGDAATRFVLPVANAIIPPAPGPLRLRSAAFTPRLRSHTVEEVECPIARPYRCSGEGDREFCFEASRNDERSCYEVRRRPNASNQTPFWVMTVDPRVVTDHGDIWNQNLLDLFEALLIRTAAASTAERRVLMQRTQ